MDFEDYKKVVGYDNGKASTSVSRRAPRRSIEMRKNMSAEIGDAFNREILGSAKRRGRQRRVAGNFKRETLGVIHPGHEAVMALDPEIFFCIEELLFGPGPFPERRSHSEIGVEFIITAFC